MKQNKLKVIGITGGIGTGKSTVSDLIKNEGYEVVDADIIARVVVEPGRPALHQIVSEFGEEVLNKDKTLNREKLGEIIFKDSEKRLKLNKIVHPKISEEMLGKIKKAKEENRTIFLDIPLLFEVREKLESEGILFDEVWLVYANKENQIIRVSKRDNIDKEFAKKKIDSQMDIEEKKALCDVLIDNNGNVESLKDELRSIISKRI